MLQQQCKKYQKKGNLMTIILIPKLAAKMFENMSENREIHFFAAYTEAKTSSNLAFLHRQLKVENHDTQSE